MIDAQKFEEMERRLNAWSDACRSASEELGLPRTSGIARMIEYVKTETRKEVSERRRALRKAHRQNLKTNAKTNPELVAEMYGYRDKGETAKGKQTRSLSQARQQVLTSKHMEIDREVSRLPNWMQKVIRRSYLWRQPDRVAAQDMRITKEFYQQQRIAAVWYLAERLVK